jgi:hypothetical protein
MLHDTSTRLPLGVGSTGCQAHINFFCVCVTCVHVRPTLGFERSMSQLEKTWGSLKSTAKRQLSREASPKVKSVANRIIDVVWGKGGHTDDHKSTSDETAPRAEKIWDHARLGNYKSRDFLDVKILVNYDPSKKNLPSLIQLSALTSITFTESFNASLSTIQLPELLQKLVMSRRFNQPIQLSHLPKNLTDLTLGSAFNSKIDKDALPTSLQSLSISGDFNQDLPKNLLWPCQNLRQLTLRSATYSCGLTHVGLRPTLTHLVYVCPSDPNPLMDFELEKCTRLTHLTVHCPEELRVDTYPISHLNYPDAHWLGTIVLPASLTHFHLIRSKASPKSVPIHFKPLKRITNPNWSCSRFPGGLVSLRFSGGISVTFDPGALPPKLLELILDQYDGMIGPGVLPANLAKLVIPSKYKQSLPRDLPKSLEIIYQTDKQ